MNRNFIQPSPNGSFPMIAEIKFACGHCGQKIAVGSDAAGLGIECPSCQNPVTIPRGGVASEPRTADGGFREKLTALQAECERLRANATHAQAEMKSFQNERLSLRNEVAALKQRANAAEAHLADGPLLRQRLEATETQLSSMEQECAENRTATAFVAAERDAALPELERVRRELAAAMAASARARTEAVEAQALFAETETRLNDTRAALAAAQAGLAGLQARFVAASGEAESLRGLMNRDEATRELLSTRTNLAAAEEELRMRRQTATQLEIDLLKAEADRDRLDAERGAWHRQMAGVLQRAEESSGDRLHADNAKLRELLDRQNEELKLRFKELTRFRRAKLTLKIVWGLAVLGAIGLGFLFVKILPMIEWSR